MESAPRSRPPLELWAGLECTVNRVGDEYFDQLERSGHDGRLADLELFAELGARAARYPILWERVAPRGVENADWSWTDERLGRLRELGIRPIVGLVHHGSGPRHTSLRSEEHTSELQSRQYLVCRLLLEKKQRSRGGISTARGLTSRPLRL